MGWELVKDGEKSKCWLNLDEIEIYTEGKYKGCRNWKNSVGKKFGARYKWYHDEIGEKWFIIKKHLYENKRVFLLMIDENENEFKIQTNDLLSGQFGRIFEKYTNKFKYEIGSIINDLKLLDKEYRKRERGNRRYYQYQCLKCGNIDWIDEGHIKQNRGCNVCGKTPKKVLKGVNDIATTHPHLCKYFVNQEDIYKYTAYSRQKVLLQCTDCGYQEKKEILTLATRTYRFPCPKCNDGKSVPSKFGANILFQLNKKFEVEYQINGHNEYFYDFYIPNENRLFEIDGRQHYTNAWGTAEEQKQTDTKKDEIALDNGYELIRIDCYYSDFEYLKENFINVLSPFYDLSNIDWENAYLESQKSHMILACQLKKENQNLFTVDIIKLIEEKTGIKYSTNTISRWLRRGNELGLCYYNGKEEVAKGGKKRSGINHPKTKKVAQISLTTKEIIKIWDSARESGEMLGFNYRTLKSYLQNDRKTHEYKGFLWYYFDEWQQLTTE